MTRRKSRRMMNQINVVPYIDVMLVLLVIFMVTAPMTNPGGVELPSVGSSLTPQISPMLLKVKLDGTIEFNDKAMPIDQVLYAVQVEREKNPQRSVLIAADKNVKYDEVIRMMDLLKTGKIDKVGLLLTPAN
ncbi:MAG: biopolymer transporter ExbD [Methylophilaceae bacterium]|nr:biopolymer transporter ExbD [Methylophilaceae bacterium]